MDKLDDLKDRLNKFGEWDKVDVLDELKHKFDELDEVRDEFDEMDRISPMSS